MTHLTSRRIVLLIATNISRRPQPEPCDDAVTSDSYANLADLCAERGLELRLTHFANLHSKSVALSWQRVDGRWRPAQCFLADVDLAYADLPQNFPEAAPFRQALIDREIPVVNSLSLSDCLTDKSAAYDLFPEYVPTTWNAADPELARRLRRVALHPDLDVERLFLKPRFGERGRGISVATPRDFVDHPDAGRPDVIVQPFLETNAGIPELGIRERHDLRLLLRNGRIELCFARMPAEGSLVSNCSQGGRELEIDPELLPARIREFAAEVDARLNDFGTRFYSLDLGMGRSGKIWIYELNTMPGIAWSLETSQDRSLRATMHQALMRWLVDAASRASDEKTRGEASDVSISERNTAARNAAERNTAERKTAELKTRTSFTLQTPVRKASLATGSQA